MQGDGNLVLYRNRIVGCRIIREAVWSSGTCGHPGAYLVVQNDGNVVIYDPYGRALWNTGTWWAG
jgi:hypothetical protein